MKTPATRKPSRAGSADLAGEYHFDYSKAKPNRFAEGAAASPLIVVLDEEIASVFPDAASVTAVLRALVRAMPPKSAAARPVSKAAS
jgi:hypothetical protein